MIHPRSMHDPWHMIHGPWTMMHSYSPRFAVHDQRTITHRPLSRIHLLFFTVHHPWPMIQSPPSMTYRIIHHWKNDTENPSMSPPKASVHLDPLLTHLLLNICYNKIPRISPLQFPPKECACSWFWKGSYSTHLLLKKNAYQVLYIPRIFSQKYFSRQYVCTKQFVQFVKGSRVVTLRLQLEAWRQKEFRPWRRKVIKCPREKVQLCVVLLLTCSSISL